MGFVIISSLHIFAMISQFSGCWLDFVCLYTYEFWLSVCKIVRSSVILLLPLFIIYFDNGTIYNYDCGSVTVSLANKAHYKAKIQLKVALTIHYPFMVHGWLWLGLWCFNNISVISLRSVLLMEKTKVPGENHRPVTSHWQTLSHIVVSSTHRLSRIWAHNVSSGYMYL